MLYLPESKGPGGCPPDPRFSLALRSLNGHARPALAGGGGEAGPGLVGREPAAARLVRVATRGGTAEVVLAAEPRDTEGSGDARGDDTALLARAAAGVVTLPNTRSPVVAIARCALACRRVAEGAALRVAGAGGSRRRACAAASNGPRTLTLT